MNQQIAWSALSEFMLFMLPLVPFGAMERGAVWIGRKVGLVASPPGFAGAAAAAAQGGASGVESIEAALAAGCPCCGLQPAFQPYVATPCQHIFCYYCLSGNRLAEQQQARGAVGAVSDFKCPRCQIVITSQAPLVLAPARIRRSEVR